MDGMADIHMQAYKQRLGGSGEVGMEDLLVAIQSREAFNFVQTPPQNVSPVPLENPRPRPRPPRPGPPLPFSCHLYRWQIVAVPLAFRLFRVGGQSFVQELTSKVEASFGKVCMVLRRA